MTVLVTVPIASARATLLDAAKVTWTDDELLEYLNEAVQQTCFVKPDAYTITRSIALVAGVIQELPDDATSLRDVLLNGVGETVTQVDKALLEAADPRWGAQTPTLAIEHYTADPNNPRRFLVYPPAAIGAQATVVWCSTPPTLLIADTFPLPSAYVPCQVDYLLYRAYAKNSKRQDIAKAMAFKQQWGAALGLKTPAQYTVAPRIAVGTST